MTLIEQIQDAKQNAGENAFLWLRITGECVLFDSEAASIVDMNAVGRWQMDAAQYSQLLLTGAVDCTD